MLGRILYFLCGYEMLDNRRVIFAIEREAFRAILERFSYFRKGESLSLF